jgi:hypothetical protein
MTVPQIVKLLEVYSLEEILVALDLDDEAVLVLLSEHVDLDNLPLPEPL